jgi:hypothetical protein
MNGSHSEGRDGPTLPLRDADAERHVARLTGMTPEAARAFVAFHAGRIHSQPGHHLGGGSLA